jgi:alkanesulfonate monooxygenase SsuD/methylene tetrahydromethanopterin reductase-like flavin-dependent oxidoreductase (luciferase family)
VAARVERLLARLAAELGLPFAFAAHFAPDQLFEALDLYRTHFGRPKYSQSRMWWSG